MERLTDIEVIAADNWLAKIREDNENENVQGV